jgi:hypothetical protein
MNQYSRKETALREGSPSLSDYLGWFNLASPYGVLVSVDSAG